MKKRKYNLRNCNLISNKKTFQVIVLALVSLFICTDAAELNVKEANRMKPDHAPTPFSAAEIRSGCPAGRKITFKLEQVGKPLSYNVFKFAKGDAETSLFDIYILDAHKKPVGEKQEARVKWTDLQSHASYPTKTTSMAFKTITTVLGNFECFYYMVRIQQEKGFETKEFWFAGSLPGPPVLMVQTAPDGKKMFTMTMVANHSGEQKK